MQEAHTGGKEEELMQKPHGADSLLQPTAEEHQHSNTEEEVPSIIMVEAVGEELVDWGRKV